MRLEEVYLHKHWRQTTSLIVEAATLQLDERLHEVCMLKRQARNEVEREAEQTLKNHSRKFGIITECNNYGFLHISSKQLPIRKANFCGNQTDFRKEVEVNQLSLDHLWLFKLTSNLILKTQKRKDPQTPEENWNPERWRHAGESGYLVMWRHLGADNCGTTLATSTPNDWLALEFLHGDEGRLRRHNTRHRSLIRHTVHKTTASYPKNHLKTEFETPEKLWSRFSSVIEQTRKLEERI